MWDLKQEEKNTMMIMFNLHISMSAEASLPVGPKWILMNFPCGKMYKRTMKFFKIQPTNDCFYSILATGRGRK